MATAQFYLQAKASKNHYGDVTGAKAVKITQSRPQQPEPDCIVVKLVVHLPATAFEDVPVAEISVPIENIHAIQAESIPVEPESVGV